MIQGQTREAIITSKKCIMDMFEQKLGGLLE